MPQATTRTLRSVCAIAATAFAALALVACGGGSSNRATTTGATTSRQGATGSTGTTATTKAPSAAAVAYRKCLEAHGAGLPRLIPGTGRLGPVASGHLAPPKGVSQATYDAAVQACGGNTKSTAAKSIERYLDCMRAEGIHVPKGKQGPFSVFKDFTNPNFKNALNKCGPILKGQAAGSAGSNGKSGSTGSAD